MTYLRDQLAAAKINRIKRRIVEARAARSDCDCAVCQARRSSSGAPLSLSTVLRMLAGSDGTDRIAADAPPDAPKH